MFRLKRGPRTTQPQGATRVNWQNPIARGLVSLCVPQASGLWDAAGGRFTPWGSFAGSAIPYGDASSLRQGGGLRTMGAGIVSGTNAGMPYGSGSLTAVSCAFSARGSIGSGTSGVIQLADQTSGLVFSWSHSNGAYERAWGLNGGSFPKVQLPAALNANEWYALGCTYDRTTMRAFQGGAMVASGSVTESIAAGNYRWFNSSTSGGTFNVGYAAWWNRAIGDAEMAAFQAAPWQLFAPATRRIWVPSAGGGASSATLATTGETGVFAGTAQSVVSASLAVAGGTGAFSGAASSPAVGTLAATGESGAFAGSASSPAVAALAVTGGAGAFSGAANSTTTAAAAITGETGTFAGTAGASTSAALAATGASGVFAGTANSTTNATAAITGETGTFAGSAGSGTSASLAVTGETGVFAGTASAPASVALAALGGEGAFAGSAYPLTTAQVAALGESGTFSGVASTVGTASLATTGDSGAFSGSAISIGSAYLAALGESGTFAGSASVAAPSTVGRPASDISNSGWAASVGSDLYAMLDEVTPAPSDYIVAASVGAVCEVALNATSYPGAAAQILKFRASSSTGNSLIVRLRNVGGATVRSATQALTPTDTEYSLTLTAGEIAAITSGALSVQLESA